MKPPSGFYCTNSDFCALLLQPAVSIHDSDSLVTQSEEELLWHKVQTLIFWNSKLVCSFQVLTSSSQATSQQLHQSCLLHCWRGFSGAQVGWCSSHSKKRPPGDLVWKRGPAAPKNLRTPRTILSEVRLHGDRNPSHFNPVYSEQWPSFPPHQLLLSTFPNPNTISHTSTVSWAKFTSQRQISKQQSGSRLRPAREEPEEPLHQPLCYHQGGKQDGPAGPCRQDQRCSRSKGAFAFSLRSHAGSTQWKVCSLGGGTETSGTYGRQLPHRSANRQVSQWSRLLPRGRAERSVHAQPEVSFQKWPPHEGRQRLQLGERGKPCFSMFGSPRRRVYPILWFQKMFLFKQIH